MDCIVQQATICILLPIPLYHKIMGFPSGSNGKESACNEEDLGSLLVWEDPLEEGMATHSSILA